MNTDHRFMIIYTLLILKHRNMRSFLGARDSNILICYLPHSILLSFDKFNHSTSPIGREIIIACNSTTDKG